MRKITWETFSWDDTRYSKDGYTEYHPTTTQICDNETGEIFSGLLGFIVIVGIENDFNHPWFRYLFLGESIRDE